MYVFMCSCVLMCFISPGGLVAVGEEGFLEGLTLLGHVRGSCNFCQR